MYLRLLSIPASLALLVLLGARPSPPPPCPNLFPHEPVLLYEVAGQTLCCTIDLQLTVYGDGFVRAARGTYDGAVSRAQVAYVGAPAVQALIADLNALGASLACDIPDLTSDVPLSTLTLLRGTTDARAHTWSWLYDDGQGGAINSRLNAFLDATFPAF